MTASIRGLPGLEQRPEAARATEAVPAAPPRVEPGRGFRHVLARLGSELDRGEATMGRALRAARLRDIGTAELIALQAGIYRYAEAVDLAAKLVDRAGSAVRTTLQGQP